MNVPAVPGSRLVIGDAVYAPEARVIACAGSEQRLEPRLADLLDTLCAHPGEVLSRQELLNRVWGDEGSDEALTQAVSRLRQLLGNRDLIQTEPRKGYRLVARPQDASSWEIAEAAASGSVVIPQATMLTRDRKLFLGGVLTGIVLSALVAALLWPSPVTIVQEVTREPGEAPVSQTIQCEGTQEECAVVNDMVERLTNE